MSVRVLFSNQSLRGSGHKVNTMGLDQSSPAESDWTSCSLQNVSNHVVETQTYTNSRLPDGLRVARPTLSSALKAVGLGPLQPGRAFSFKMKQLKDASDRNTDMAAAPLCGNKTQD